MKLEKQKLNSKEYPAFKKSVKQKNHQPYTDKTQTDQKQDKERKDRVKNHKNEDKNTNIDQPQSIETVFYAELSLRRQRPLKMSQMLR